MNDKKHKTEVNSDKESKDVETREVLSTANNVAVATKDKRSLKKTSSDNLKNDNIISVFEDYQRLATEIKKSNLSPLSSESDIVTAMLSGKELGLPPMASIQNIYPIKGRSTLGIHVILGLCLDNGVTYKVIQDYVPEYSYYIAPTEQGKPPTLITEEFALKLEKLGKAIIIAKADWAVRSLLGAELKEKTLIRKDTTDYVTKVEFKRTLIVHGSPKEMTIIGEYSLGTARDAGLIKDGTQWKKNPKNQTRVRALSNGARLIGDDFLMGMMSKEEMQDVQIIEDAEIIE